ncbi:MAG: hypothetical protein V7L01_01565 [Nostoc sp.]|uniref:hypothetical protein n=1 Tax=Nostoc sp. TaxID=1180 RepID=UPI002FF7C747
MNKVEYLILKSALQCPENIINVANDYKIPNFEVVRAANSLFQNGYILAEIVNDEENIKENLLSKVQSNEDSLPENFLGKGINNYNEKPLRPIFKAEKPAILTLTQIEASLSRESGILYYLTPKGGFHWETITHPDWSHFASIIFSNTESEEIDLEEVICPSKQFIEKYLSIDCYVSPVIHVPGTEVWDVLSPWQATYWKTLPRGYRVRFQCVHNNWYIDSDTTPEWIEANDQANEWYWEFRQWYTNPEFE